jgi:hypothetical protein
MNSAEICCYNLTKMARTRIQPPVHLWPSRGLGREVLWSSNGRDTSNFSGKLVLYTLGTCPSGFDVYLESMTAHALRRNLGSLGRLGSRDKWLKGEL